jgi:hypothetical protein
MPPLRFSFAGVSPTTPEQVFCFNKKVYETTQSVRLPRLPVAVNVSTPAPTLQLPVVVTAPSPVPQAGATDETESPIHDDSVNLFPDEADFFDFEWEYPC